MKHPKVWWQMRKIKNKNLREAMNLYIGRINMIDNEHDRINFTLVTLIIQLKLNLPIYKIISFYLFPPTQLITRIAIKKNNIVNPTLAISFIILSIFLPSRFFFVICNP